MALNASSTLQTGSLSIANSFNTECVMKFYTKYAGGHPNSSNINPIFIAQLIRLSLQSMEFSDPGKWERLLYISRLSSEIGPRNMMVRSKL